MEEEPTPAILHQELPVKRRKVRKGTRSCWECKRRKTRCIFASSEDIKCNGCQRRRAPCVSQDMPEDLSPALKGHLVLGDRISKVENFMNDILSSNHVGATSHIGGEPGQNRRHSNADAIQTRSTDSTSSSIRAPLTPADVRTQATKRGLTIFPNLRPESRRVRSKFISPHTGLTRGIGPSCNRNYSPSLPVGSLSGRGRCQDSAERELETVAIHRSGQHSAT